MREVLVPTARTGFEYELEIGLSYRFGSIFNNVVNNRFLGMSRGF
jgi:hypothetical protein